MSLLIKALASAEKGKQAELANSDAVKSFSADLVLEPLAATRPNAQPSGKRESESASGDISNKADAFNIAAAASVAKVRQQSQSKKDDHQKVAANVFVANQALEKSSSPWTLFMLGAAGALIIWLVLQGYQYLSKLNAPQAAAITTASQGEAGVNSAQLPLPEAQTGVVANSAALPAAESVNDSVQVAQSATAAVGRTTAETVMSGTVDNGATVNIANQPQAKKVAADRVVEYSDAPSEHAEALKRETPLKLISRTPSAGINPVLLSAYEAYNRGDDATAQKQYREVLQSDMRNVDALLGMAAIALRQSRHADANGWYQKVLEIEPRNSTALSAIANSQISTESADYAGNESRIKNMLAQQPEAANLHAALGNLYAAQEQWSLAQAAYFDASRYAPNSADYAFNLAVSLDQLGKSSHALAQYQRALDLLNHSGTGSLDKAQLEARIKALQQ